MATFEYVEIPADAIRLKNAAVEPATKITTAFPDTSSPMPRAAADPLSPTKTAFSLVPQMLLSASIPTSLPPTASIISSAITTPNPRATSQTLLSTRDPLSVQIMSVNFRRFVSRVGPLFWLQDRVEEVVLWKKGWKHTAVWLAAYGFFCYFPRMALLIPHLVLLIVMLGYYPDPGVQPVPINASEATVDWQANMQGIQNLMGIFSDVYDAVVPLLPLLVAPPATNSHPPNPSPQPTLQPHHPFLIAMLLSFLVLLPILMTDLLPLRLLFFLAGAGSVGALHPRIRESLSETARSVFSGSGPGISFQLAVNIPLVPNPLTLFPKTTHCLLRRFCSLAPLVSPCARMFSLTISPRDIHVFFRQLVDNDRLDDHVWPAPLAQVELWENERWVPVAAERSRRKSVVMFVREGDDEGGDDDDAASTTSTSTMTVGTTSTFTDGGKAPTGTWSKSNLKPNERVGWTRGRDGWCGVGGEISSNLTFSLSPGWAFIDTEGWRADLNAAWAVDGTPPNASVCVGADEGDRLAVRVRVSRSESFAVDGWTYTTDTWTHPRPDGRPSDGWVTRRRRWVRRVYFKGDER